MTTTPPAKPKSKEDLLAYLQDLGIAAATTEHPPVHTVADNKALRGDLDGGHCKNLFLKDKKGQLWLVSTLEDRKVDMKELKKRMGAAHLSFGQPPALMAALGVEPGSVTPFAVINDPVGKVRVVLDQALHGFDLLNFHPLTNTATTSIHPGDLVRFLEATGHPPATVDLDTPGAP